MSSGRPVFLHVTSFAFGGASHPGIFRCVQGLAGRAENVVLHWGDDRYGSEPEQAASALPPGVHAYPLAAPKLLKKPFAVAHLLAGVRRRHGPPTAVIAHFGNNGWRSLPLAAWGDVPILTLFHGEDAARRVNREEYADGYQRLFAAPGARYLAVAAHLARSLCEAGAPEEAVAVHHLGVPLPRLREADAWRPDGGRLRVGLIGRLLPVKGHAMAIEALALAGESGAELELHCYGEGPARPEIESLRAGSQARERIFLHGNLPAAELEDALRELDLVIQPSVSDPDGRAEGLPNALLEAMALGLPAIGSEHGGIPEAIVHEETGLLVPEGSASALAAALCRLARDPDERQRMGAAGRQRVETEFSLEGQGERLRARIQEMVQSYRGIPGQERREAWARCVAGLAEPRRETARREQLRWALRIARNRFAGAIP